MNLAASLSSGPAEPAVRALAGVDFSSAPRRGKPIVWAWGRLERPGLLRLERFEDNTTLAAFEQALHRPGPWLAAFDLPFGLPRELVATLGWPTDWAAGMTHYAGLSREAIVDTFSAFCDARPVGGKFAHRACDGPAGSSPSMKWVNPPVAFMLHAGVPALRAAGVDIPGLHAGDPTRVALEGYPGMVARALIGRRSYKSDTRAQQTPERLIARKDLVDALEQGRWRGLRLKLTHAQRDELVADPQGDRLDAALCLLLAGWADTQPGHGMPADVDALEGWIVAADGLGADLPPAREARAQEAADDEDLRRSRVSVSVCRCQVLQCNADAVSCVCRCQVLQCNAHVVSRDGRVKRCIARPDTD